VLHIVHKCIVNQKCGRIVNMHPIGDMCPFLITDKHYLMENLLCLMSNGEWSGGRSYCYCYRYLGTFKAYLCQGVMGGVKSVS
jgi:hypothetical protein